MAVVWVASLVAVKLWAQGTGGTFIDAKGQHQMGDPIGPIVTGDGFGFQQVAAPPDPSGRVAVRLVVKVNGEWHEATTSIVRVVR